MIKTKTTVSYIVCMSWNEADCKLLLVRVNNACFTENIVLSHRLAVVSSVQTLQNTSPDFHVSYKTWNLRWNTRLLDKDGGRVKASPE